MEYTVSDFCPDCFSENIQAIDREYSREDGCWIVRHICNDCGCDWQEEDI